MSAAEGTKTKVNLQMKKVSRNKNTDENYKSINLSIQFQAELEEDLSFQILRDSETVHKYVASRGQREREEDIYEVLPPSVVIMSKTK